MTIDPAASSHVVAVAQQVGAALATCLRFDVPVHNVLVSSLDGGVIVIGDLSQPSAPAIGHAVAAPCPAGYGAYVYAYQQQGAGTAITAIAYGAYNFSIVAY